MSTFWMFYLGTFFFIVLLTTLTIVLFELSNGESIHTSYAIIVNIMGAIPFLNFFVMAVLITVLCIALGYGDLVPKDKDYHGNKNYFKF